MLAALKFIKAQEIKREMDLNNTFKIYLRRSIQRSYVYLYDLTPTILPNANIQYWDTPAGTLYDAYKKTGSISTLDPVKEFV